MILDKEEDTALHCCVRRGCWLRVEQLIRAGADLEKKNSDGNTPLHELVFGWTQWPELIDDYLQVSVSLLTLNYFVSSSGRL